MLPKDELVRSVDYLFNNLDEHIDIHKYRPRQTYNFVIAGKSGSGKSEFVECVSRFAPVNVIYSIEPIMEMAKIVEMEENNDFLKQLRELVSKYSNYINDYCSVKLKSGCLNFIHMKDERNFNKTPFTWMVKVLVDDLNNNNHEFTKLSDFNFNYDRYQHIIKNNDNMKSLPNKALQFVQIYCDRFDEI